MNITGYRQIAAITVILILGLFLTWSLSGFLTSFLSAIIFYVMLKPLMRNLIVKRKWKKSWSALLVMLLSFVTILLPFWGLYTLMSEKVYYVINHGSDVMQGLHQMDDFIFRKTGQKILSDDTLKKIQDTLASIIPQLLGATASVLTDIGMMYFILYYLLINIGTMEKSLQDFLPVSDENAQRFADELESMVNSNVMGAPLLAILQGICAGLGFWIFGLDEPWFWGVICGFMSFLPVVGTAMVWIPAGIYMITAKTNWQGSGILIYGAVVITNIDNVFRFWLQKKFADVHPLVTVLGVIIGLNWFGIPGIVFGPLALSYFLLMVKMYKEEYGEKKLFRSSDSPE